jgi:hypothetical protein
MSNAKQINNLLYNVSGNNIKFNEKERKIPGNGQDIPESTVTDYVEITNKNGSKTKLEGFENTINCLNSSNEPIKTICAIVTDMDKPSLKVNIGSDGTLSVENIARRRKNTKLVFRHVIKDKQLNSQILTELPNLHDVKKVGFLYNGGISSPVSMCVQVLFGNDELLSFTSDGKKAETKHLFDTKDLKLS